MGDLTGTGNGKGKLHKFDAKSNKKRDILGVLDAEISYFAGPVANYSAKMTDFKTDKSPISAIKAHFNP